MATDFEQSVWAACSRIPKGKLATYGQRAAMIGYPSAARAVGQALGRNPHAPRVPCHRVVAADGRLTGYNGGMAKKIRLLRDEGVELRGERVVTLSRYRWGE